MSSDSANLALLQQKLAAQESLRQADRDFADQVLNSRTAQNEAREQALRAEVARAMAEAMSQVRLEHELAMNQARLEHERALNQAQLEHQQAMATKVELLELARRTAEEREGYAARIESDAADRERDLVAEAERRHSAAIAAMEATLAKRPRSPGSPAPCGDCPRKDQKIIGLESTVSGLRELARTYEGDARKLQEALALTINRD